MKFCELRMNEAHVVNQFPYAFKNVILQPDPIYIN